jgi:hypothetical protein
MEEERHETEWLSGLADELAQALVDAAASAMACEELLEASRGLADRDERQRLLRAIVLPAAVSRILVDLIDRPPPLVLVAVRICRETSLDAIAQLEVLAPALDCAPAAAALERAAGSCGRLLDAAEAI